MFETLGNKLFRTLDSGAAEAQGAEGSAHAQAGTNAQDGTNAQARRAEGASTRSAQLRNTAQALAQSGAKTSGRVILVDKPKVCQRSEALASLFPFEPAQHGAGGDFFGVQVKIALRNVL